LIFRYLKSALAKGITIPRQDDICASMPSLFPTEEPTALPKLWLGHQESSQLSKAQLQSHHRQLQSEAYDRWMHLSEDPDLLARQQHIRTSSRQQRLLFEVYSITISECCCFCLQF